MRNYVEHAVHGALERLVVCTWIDRPTEQPHAVLPDACIDIVWDGARLSIAGPDTSAWQVVSRATLVGIRFRPGAAPAVLGVAAGELLDRTTALSDVWGREADELAERLADDPAGAPGLLEQCVLARDRSAGAPDPLVDPIVEWLDQSAGKRPLARSLARHLGVSERTLHRRCVTAVGYGPKTLDRVLRFRRAMRLIRASVPLSETAQRAGYADQAHLTYEFNRLAGAAPGQLLRAPQFALSANGYA